MDSVSRESSDRGLSVLVNPSVPYCWGTGWFRDIAHIRRRVYTTYYTLTEQRDLLRGIISCPVDEHIDRMLETIEDPTFGIENLRYEEIKAFLWEEAHQEFRTALLAWEDDKDAAFIRQSEALVTAFLEQGRLIDVHESRLRRLILTAAALQIFDILKWTQPQCVLAELDEMLEREGTPQGLNLGIDHVSELCSRLSEPGKVAVVLGDINSAAIDLKVFVESVLLRWIDTLRQSGSSASEEQLFRSAKELGWEIVIVVNERFVPRNNNHILQRGVTAKNVLDLLRLEVFERLRDLYEIGLVSIAPFHSRYEGTVLTDIAESAQTALTGADWVLAFGEQNNLTLNGLMNEQIRVAPIRDFGHIFFTGIKFDKEISKYPKFSVLAVPAGVLPAIDYEPDIESKLTARQFAAVKEILTGDQWKDAVESVRKSGGNVLDYAQEIVSLNQSQKLSLRCVRGSSLSDRIDRARSLLRPYGGHYARLDQKETAAERRVIHVIHFPWNAPSNDASTLTLGIEFAAGQEAHDGRPKSKLTFDALVRERPAVLIAFNFLYFITRNLLLYFNNSNRHFVLGDQFFGDYIDLLKAEIGGRKCFYPPLFNKGAVGLSADNRIVFGRLQLPNRGIVRLPIGNRLKEVAWEALNPLDPSAYTAALYTPSCDTFRHANRKAPHTYGEQRSMYFVPDADRYNFVMINDKLLGVVSGETEIPPFGTVLSVSKVFFSNEERALLDMECAARCESPKIVTEQVKVAFECDLGETWREMQWILGGGLLMVDDGRIEALDAAKTDDPSVYSLEGWALESSQRTQETPVETDLREARTTIGTTQDGEFFISVIEGRANNRTGATHRETIDWLKQYFDTKGKVLRYALDLDSASSVTLGVVQEGAFHLLNQTARGSDSKLWDTRYHNHIGYLYVKR